MRFIHCADLHLDSRMTTHLSGEKARERKAELLHTFQQMIAYGAEHQVDGIIIAGDLYDTKAISAAAANAVRDAVLGHPDMTFYYLRGNHDADNFLNRLEEIPENLKLFGDTWTSHDTGRGRIVITGVELNAANSVSVYDALSLNREDFNIVVLHGQDAEYGAKDKAETISLRRLRDKGIDYLALGHVHSYKSETLDSRGCYCYPGCLEGRGFDECGSHGFVLLDVDEERHTMSHTFVPFARRNLYEIPADVSGCMTNGDILKRTQAALAQADISPGSMVKLVLTGAVDVDCEKNPELLAKQLEGRFYFLKISDETKLRVDYQAFALDESLKGEFVRLVGASDLEEQEKAAVIRCGIRALLGEDLEAEEV